MAQLTQDELRRLIAERFIELGIDAKRAVLPTSGSHPIFENRRIVLVDDSREVFAVFAPRLLARTNGTAMFIHCRDGAPQEIAQQIMAAKPDLVLVDGQLGGTLRGWDVVFRLYELQSELPCVGFSSDPQFERHFVKNRAAGFVHKDVERPEVTMSALGEQLHILFS